MKFMQIIHIQLCKLPHSKNLCNFLSLQIAIYEYIINISLRV